MSVREQNARTQEAMRRKAAEKPLFKRRPPCTNCRHMALNHTPGGCRFWGCECSGYVTYEDLPL